MKNQNKSVIILLVMLFGVIPISIKAQHLVRVSDKIIPASITGFAKDKLGNIYAGTSNGLYKSADHGNRWFLAGLAGASVWPICCDSNNHILACQNHSLFLSIDSGRTWIKKPTVLNWSLTADKFGNIYGRADNLNEFWKSTDGGNNWSMTLQSAGQLRMVVDTMGNLFGSPTSDNDFPYIFKSSDQGLTWTSHTLSIDWHSDWSPRTLYVSPNNILYVGTSFKGIYTTKDTGATWSWPLHNGGTYIGTIISNDNDSTILATSGTDGYAKLLTSFDGGQTWNFDKKLLWSDEYEGTLNPILVRDTGNLVHLGVSSSAGVWDSYDFGRTWQQHSSGLSSLTSYCLAYDPRKGTLIMGTSDGVYYSDNKGANWLKPNTSTDGKVVYSIVVPKQNTLVIANDDSIRVSTDYGISWTSSLGGLGLGSRVVFDSITQSIFAYDSSGLFYRSVDYALNWTSLGKIIPANDTITTVAVRGRILVGTLHGLIRTSLNDGATWTDLGSPISGRIFSLSINSKDLYAGAVGWLYSWDPVSNDWKRKNVGVNYTPLFIAANNQKDIFLVNSDGFIYNSYDGTNWHISQGELPLFVDFQFFDNTLYALHSNTWVYRGHLTVGVKELLKEEQLYSIYPNPSIDRQTCYLSLPNVANPIVKLFTVTGIEIPVKLEKLSNENTFLLKWESSLPKGVYSLQIMSKGTKLTDKALVITY